jgi:APA family basic amino acid/polyamine antiporter
MVTYAAEETREPERTIPRALLFGVLIVTACYVALNAAYFHVLLPEQIAKSTRVAADAADAVLGHGGAAFMSALVAVSTFGALNGVILSGPRAYLAMARDGLLPPSLARVSGAHRTPVAGTLLTGAVAALIAGVIPLATLGELISLGTLLAFTTVCIGVPVLRRIDPGAQRPFRTPWVPAVPVLGIVSCVVLMVSFPGATWLQLCAWSALGLVIYFAYGRRHSRLRGAAPSAGGGGARA